MLTLDQAREIAQVILGTIQAGLREPLILIEPPVEFTGGWVFSYNTERFIETGEVSAALGGNGPIAVFRSGNVEILGTADSVEIQIARLDARGRP